MTSKQVAKVRQTRFPMSLFFVLFFVILLMSGLHTGLIVLMNQLQINEMIQVIVPIVYWASVATGLTLYTRWKIKQTYDVPMRVLAAATSQVAAGDFSIYVPPYHTADKLDYLDVMLLDFNKMVAELGSIETLKTDFFSNVSHEIKTPIAIIQNYAELLTGENLSEDNRREYTENIQQATKKLSTLISNMLKLDKLEKQTIRPQLEPFDVSAQLCDCVLQLENLWDEKGLELVIDVEERVLLTSDSALLDLVWTNLLSNAIKFSTPGDLLTVQQQSTDQQIIVQIADTGCGMDEATTARIFDKFYQGDTSHATEGNGLGLALVQRILEVLNGKIIVESYVGQGTTFTVTLPIKGGNE